uniref:Uncharacterized protein n=1 Tax=Cacopsylla melanoneura TaxID=428564 RepID=A0A8D8W933_9HEMI
MVKSLREYIQKHRVQRVVSERFLCSLNCFCYSCANRIRMSSGEESNRSECPSPQSTIKDILSSSDSENEVEIVKEIPSTQENFQMVEEEVREPPPLNKPSVSFAPKKTVVEIPKIGTRKVSRKSPKKKVATTVTLTKAQSEKIWNTNPNNFKSFLLLLWCADFFKMLIPYMETLQELAMDQMNLDMKKKVVVWTKALQMMRKSIGAEEFEKMSWTCFSEQCSKQTYSTVFIDFTIPTEWRVMFIDAFKKFRLVFRTPTCSSLPATATTSTSCTTAPGPAQPAAVPVSRTLNDCSAPTPIAPSGGLFENLNGTPSVPLIPCSIWQRDGGKLNTASSDGFSFDLATDQVIKVDILPYSIGCRTDKKDWWRATTFRSTVAYSKNSELAAAVDRLQAAIMMHMERKQVGTNIKVESKALKRNIEDNESYGGFGRFQRRQ